MDPLVALTILAGKVELRQNPTIQMNWDLVIQVPTFFGAKNIPKVYCITGKIAYNQDYVDNKVFEHFKAIVDWHWAESGRYAFDDNTPEEFNKIINELKPKALLQFMDIIDVTENFDMEQVLNSVKECFVRDAIES